MLYVMLSKGYKPGGFNPVPDESGLPKRFDTENLWNLDLGANTSLLDGRLTNKINLFYGKRIDQVKLQSNGILWKKKRSTSWNII